MSTPRPLTKKKRVGRVNVPRKDSTAAPVEDAHETPTGNAEATTASEEPAAPSPAPERARRGTSRLTHGRTATGVPATGRLAIAWHRGDWELARDTYEYAWNSRDFAPEVPPIFGDWLGDVLERWAKHTPNRRATILTNDAALVEEQRRAKIAHLDATAKANGEPIEPDRAKPRSYRMREDVFTAVDTARAEDSRSIRGQISRGQWARDALRAELARAVRHNNGDSLPLAGPLTPAGRTTPRP